MKQKAFSLLIAILFFSCFGQLPQVFALSASGANDYVRFINQQTALLQDCQNSSLTACENKLSSVAMKVRAKLRSVQSKLHPYDAQKMQAATASFIVRAREILAGVKVATSSLESDFTQLETIANDLPTNLMPSLAANENSTFPNLARLLRDSETLLIDGPKIKKSSTKLVNFDIDLNLLLNETYAEFSELIRNSVHKTDLEYLNETVQEILDNVEEALKVAERRLSSKFDNDLDGVREKINAKMTQLSGKLSSLQMGVSTVSNVTVLAATKLNASQLIVSLMRADNSINQLKIKAATANNRSDFYRTRDSLLNVVESVSQNLNKAGILNAANLSLVRLYVNRVNQDTLETLEVLEQNMPSRMTSAFTELENKVLEELSEIQTIVAGL
ncbi:MAG: hypothetical protein PHU71_03020 [Candidatus Gracilibacteria bacterium]|nr:hypothetical protein [Candidatus Gracilibacteria bacterium]